MFFKRQFVQQTLQTNSQLRVFPNWPSPGLLIDHGDGFERGYGPQVCTISTFVLFERWTKFLTLDNPITGPKEGIGSVQINWWCARSPTRLTFTTTWWKASPKLRSFPHHVVPLKALLEGKGRIEVTELGWVTLHLDLFRWEHETLATQACFLNGNESNLG